MNAEEIANRIASIRQDEVHGATELARQGVQLLLDMAADRSMPEDYFSDLFLDTTRDLAHARPSIASLVNAVGVVFTAWQEAGGACSAEASRTAAGVAARRWMERQEAMATVIADHTAEVVSGTVMTLSYSTTVVHALEECWAREVLKRVFVAESRPLYEGREAASALASRGIPTVLITDAEMGIFVAEADAAVVGADTIRPDGSLVNRTGTFLLALAARHRRMPFYTLAETHKIAPAAPRAMPFELEEKDPAEVLPDPIPRVAVRNVFFDLTPARYLTGYITEDGLLNRQDIAALSREAPGVIMGSRLRASPGPASPP